MKVNLEELDRIVDQGMRSALSESDGHKIKAALHAMADRLTPKRSTEKTSAVLEDFVSESAAPADEEGSSPAGHGRTALLRLRAQPKFRFRMLRFSPATLVRNAAPEKSTGKRNRPH